MKYIDYHKMKEFYTIAEVCHLFEMDKKELRYYSEKYGIFPQEDQYGNHGFRKVLVRKLYNYIYKEQKNSKFSSAPYCSFYVPPREMYMLLPNLLQLIIKLLHNLSIAHTPKFVTKKRSDLFNQTVSFLKFLTCCIVVSKIESTAAVSSCVSDCSCSESFCA